MTRHRLRILFATVSGTAREVAETLALGSATLPPEAIVVEDMQDVEIGVFDPEGPTLLLVVATTGSGDVPPDAAALYQALQQEPRYLGGVRYGLIALGDSSYGSTFCGGGRAFDAVLLDLGAQRLSEPLLLDACEVDEPASAALQWFEKWVSANAVTQP